MMAVTTDNTVFTHRAYALGPADVEETLEYSAGHVHPLRLREMDVVNTRTSSERTCRS